MSKIKKAADLSQIRAVTFDAGHTLFDPYPSVGEIYREIALQHGLDYPAEQLEAGFRRAFANVSKDPCILDGEARERSFWRRVVEASIEDQPSAPKHFDALFEDLWNTFSEGQRWKAADGAAETLAQLKASGYRIALLSNWDSRARQVIADHGFDAYFERLFISSEIGFEKPDVRIFRHVEQALGLLPNQLLHVGDSLKHDHAGASGAGWASAILTDGPVPEGAFALGGLRDLLELLP